MAIQSIIWLGIHNGTEEPSPSVETTGGRSHKETEVQWLCTRHCTRLELDSDGETCVVEDLPSTVEVDRPAVEVHEVDVDGRGVRPPQQLVQTVQRAVPHRQHASRPADPDVTVVSAAQQVRRVRGRHLRASCWTVTWPVMLTSSYVQTRQHEILAIQQPWAILD